MHNHTNSRMFSRIPSFNGVERAWPSAVWFATRTAGGNGVEWFCPAPVLGAGHCMLEPLVPSASERFALESGYLVGTFTGDLTTMTAKWYARLIVSMFVKVVLCAWERYGRSYGRSSQGYSEAPPTGVGQSCGGRIR
jgi:hypothetical protein